MNFKNLPVVKPELLSLGKKLGAARIKEIIRKFYDRLAADVLVGFFFDGKNLDLIAQGQTAFLLKAFGITQSYTGHAPSEAHSALPPILEGHFDRRLVILDQLLRDEGLNVDERAAWVGFENAFRSAVVS